MNGLEEENSRLRLLLAGAVLDSAMLREVSGKSSEVCRQLPDSCLSAGDVRGQGEASLF